MLDSYFFIPGDKKKYIDKIESIPSDFLVVDLEDSVPVKSKGLAQELALKVAIKDNYYIRIPFFENRYTDEELKKLILHYEGRIAVPKVNDVDEIYRIKTLAPDLKLKMIILVETPRCLINIKEIFDQFSTDIHGVTFGSHDFCSLTGIKPTEENINTYKRDLVLYTKAYNVKFIDGVNLDLSNFSQFRKECVSAFEMGMEGKFLIHPMQLDKLKEIEYFTKDEMMEIKEVYEHIKSIPSDSIEVYKINGKVYEKPHLLRIKKIMSKLDPKK
ncbi:Citrate lyase beta subunit [Lishizhenia tianjinensis]|uniref:Citrate lyase beta subunit n=1 Tax=Lishizhenia tianjinensis TaxID=477690 RepID=A0A1I6ZJP8_9FLAO|nr:aldolase/citrate lyase family protein [Lishizhenia tianjinensis]SFT62890.1 Citrate lyase beta subunit [Lishizhenia tianjinensis]